MPANTLSPNDWARLEPAITLLGQSLTQLGDCYRKLLENKAPPEHCQEAGTTLRFLVEQYGDVLMGVCRRRRDEALLDSELEEDEEASLDDNDLDEEDAVNSDNDTLDEEDDTADEGPDQHR